MTCVMALALFAAMILALPVALGVLFFASVLFSRYMIWVIGIAMSLCDRCTGEGG